MNKKLLAFDLDGTLVESKTALSPSMSHILSSLLNQYKIAIVTGAEYERLLSQVIQKLDIDQNKLSNLYILPACGTQFYSYQNAAWGKVYSETLSKEERTKIINALETTYNTSGFRPEKIYGDLIRDIDSQITLSAIGQDAPIEVKVDWDKDFRKREVIKAKLQKLIPEFSIKIGGTTSIDITKPGIDKAFGVSKIIEILNLQKEDILFFGDAIVPEGNDLPVKLMGVDSILVKDHLHTEELLKQVLSSGVRSISNEIQK
jgi:phosphomannomutase